MVNVWELAPVQANCEIEHCFIGFQPRKNTCNIIVSDRSVCEGPPSIKNIPAASWRGEKETY